MPGTGSILALLFSSLACVAPHDDDQVAAAIEVRVEPSRDRQVIDGFGGSLAYWGVNADEVALRQALGEVGATIVRVPGEVSQSGDAEGHLRALRRVAQVAPGAGVFVTFWQPRSRERIRPEDWLDVDDAGKYRIRPSMVGPWADEMVARIRLIRDVWGAKVVAVGVQNEPNFSQQGTPTCAWEPAQLAEFIDREFAPRMAAAGLGSIPIAAPELAYIGDGAAEARRFAPAMAGPSTSIFSYHMYDSYRDGTPDPGLDGMRARQRALGVFLRQDLGGKRVWMTETTGSQSNGKEWHTLGWSEGLDEHDKALAAAQYMHAVLVEAGANAFLWWGLVYSEAPADVTGARERQKFRDEGLVLVKPEAVDGSQAYLERTPKSYAFQQFAGFVRPGWVRIDVVGPAGPLVAAFRSPDRREVAVVLIQPGKAASARLDLRVSGPMGYRQDRAYVTDRARRCELSPWKEVLSPESVTTLIYVAEGRP